MTPEDHERVAVILGEDGSRAWADALSREWPVSSGEIMEMHRKLDFFGVKSWRIPWLIQELLRGKRIVICCELPTFKPEKDLRREAWFDDLITPMPCGPIKLRRRTIDVPEVAALLLPKEPRTIDYARFSELIRGPKNTTDLMRSIASIASLEKQGIV